MLVLGGSETVGQAAGLFAPLPGKERIYERREGPPPEEVGLFPVAFARNRSMPLGDGPSIRSVSTAPRVHPPNLKQLAEDVLLQRFAPAAVLVTGQGDIVYISGKTGRYLEPAAGKANLNLIAMAREGLNHALAEGFHRAIRDNAAVTLTGVKVGTNGAGAWLDVHVQPLGEPTALQGLAMVIFDERPAPEEQAPSSGELTLDKEGSLRMATLQREVQRAHEDLQATREEMQVSQEELRSTNEELQSTNEELQSTNEELTTSKEEMQSLNEELQTVNHELTAKVEELALTADDMSNLLNSTNLATLFLNASLSVRRFTPAATHLIKLIPSDVGRPITDLTTILDYPDLAKDAREVLRSLVAIQRDVPSQGGGWFAAHILPYRTRDDRIDGVVITFSDISVAKALEWTLRETTAALQAQLEGRDAQLDTSRGVEATLRQAQALLETRIAEQRTAMREAGIAPEMKAADMKRPTKES